MHNNTRYRSLAAGAACLLALGLTACGGSDNEASTDAASTASSSATDAAASATETSTDTYPVDVKDCGESITVKEKPEGVLTVGTAAVALLDAAGASSFIKARAGEFGAGLPEGLTNPPKDSKVIDPEDPSAEKILGAGVDTVYGYGLFKATPEQLEPGKLTLLTVQGECGHDGASDSGGASFATVAADVKRLGTVFGTSDTATKAAEAMEGKVAALAKKKAGKGANAAWVYYFSSNDPLSAYGAASMAQDILAQADLKNVFASEKKAYLSTNAEALASAAPEWLVVGYGLYGDTADDAKKKIEAEPGLAELKAVKDGHVIYVPGTVSEASPQAVGGLQTVVDGLEDH